MDRVLSAGAEERAAVARAARELVERRHSLVNYGREMARRLEQVADEPLPAPGRVAVN
jgi:hypothetical protein